MKSEIQLSQICKIILSGTPKTSVSEYWHGNIKWVTPTDITNINQRYIQNTERTISEKGIQNSSAKLLDKNTIIISARGTVGELCILPFEMSCNQSCYALKPDLKLVKPMYLFYVLKNLKNYYSQIAHGTTFDTITKSAFDEIKINLHSLKEQEKIVNHLDYLDSQIENLQKQNKILEQIARAIFKSWFVDFDGVTEFEDSELGKIPKGWNVKNLSNVCKIVMGQSPPSISYNKKGKGIIFFQGKTDFGDFFPTPRIYCTAPKKFAEKNDVLFTVRAPIGAMNIAREKCSIGRGLASLRLKNNHGSFLYYFLKNSFEEWQKFEADGTVYGAVTKDNVLAFKIITPPLEAITSFNQIVDPLYYKIWKNSEQIQFLNQFRDTLLPKLMSGEIRV